MPSVLCGSDRIVILGRRLRIIFLKRVSSTMDLRSLETPIMIAE